MPKNADTNDIFYHKILYIYEHVCYNQVKERRCREDPLMLGSQVVSRRFLVKTL